MKTFKKVLRKIIGYICLTIGFLGITIADANVPLWGTLLIIIGIVAGFFFGACFLDPKTVKEAIEELKSDLKS